MQFSIYLEITIHIQIIHLIHIQCAMMVQEAISKANQDIRLLVNPRTTAMSAVHLMLNTMVLSNEPNQLIDLCSSKRAACLRVLVNRSSIWLNVSSFNLSFLWCPMQNRSLFETHLEWTNEFDCKKNILHFSYTSIYLFSFVGMIFMDFFVYLHQIKSKRFPWFAMVAFKHNWSEHRNQNDRLHLIRSLVPVDEHNW